MARTLVIDAGNTRLKAAIFDSAGGEPAQATAVPAAEGAAAVRLFAETHRPAGIMLASVGQGVDDLRSALAECGVPVRILDGRTPLPIANAYRAWDSVGPDRLAAATGVQAGAGGAAAMAIALGTCVTYNFVTANGAFRGGAISPGLQMRLKAMHHYTAALPEVSAEGDARLLGYDTESSLRSGAINGLAAEIEGMMARFTAEYGPVHTVLTGGDAPRLASFLPARFPQDPYLTLKGINLILRYNVPSLR